MTALLEVRNMTRSFGGLRAVSGFSLTLEAGQIHGLIGPNGAGKTTVFNLITGVHAPDAGEILLKGRSIRSLEPHRIAALGVSRTFQNLRLWRHLSVLDHVRLAHYSQLRYGLFGALLGSRACRRQEEEITAHSFRLLETFQISRFADQLAPSLPYGAQRRLEMARAMAVRPKLLLLDEPTAGMTPDELGQMIGIIRQAHKAFGIAILLIEHRMQFVMELCDSVQVLVFGEVIAQGTPQAVQKDPQVIEAYLGREEVH